MASDRAWHAFLATAFVGALLIRVICILAHRFGGDDLHIYVDFARFILHGENPYDQPAHGTFDPKYGDNSVGELGFFAAILALYDSRTALRGAFIVADLTTLALLAFGYVRSRWWKAQLMVFYAFNPLILDEWAINGDDKTVLFCLIVMLLVTLERGWLIGAWVAATVLGVLKWLSAYFLVPLVLYTGRALGFRWAASLLAGSLLAVVVSMVPYFPDSLTPIHRRQDRLQLAPRHASFTRLLDEVGLYRPAVVTVLTALAILGILILFLTSRIDLREAIVLSIASAFVFLPDNGLNRLVFVATPFLLIMRLSARRLVVIWLASLVSVAAGVITSRKFESAAHSGRVPLGTTLTDLLGPYGSTQFVLLANVYLVVILGLFASDRLRGRVDVQSHANALRLQSARRAVG